MNKQEKIKLMDQLMQEHPFCYWCGIRVRRVIPGIGEVQPDDMATFDHLVSRYFRKRGEEVQKVLACNKCNARRSQEETRMMLELNREAVFNPKLRWPSA